MLEHSKYDRPLLTSVSNVVRVGLEILTLLLLIAKASLSNVLRWGSEAEIACSCISEDNNIGPRIAHHGHYIDQKGKIFHKNRRHSGGGDL